MASGLRGVFFDLTPLHGQSADMPGAKRGAQAPLAPAPAPAGGPPVVAPSPPLNWGNNPFAAPAPGNAPFNPTPMFNTILITGRCLRLAPRQGCCRIEGQKGALKGRRFCANGWLRFAQSDMNEGYAAGCSVAVRLSTRAELSPIIFFSKWRMQ